MSTTSLLSSVLERTTTETLIRKRDGRIVTWDLKRVIRAIALAFHDVRTNNGPKTANDAQYGLSYPDYVKVLTIANHVYNVIQARYFSQSVQPTIEQIQDVVEISLMAEAEYEVAKAFMLYRARRNVSRLTRYDPRIISDYIITAKYVRYLTDKKRRETLDEAVDRVLQIVSALQGSAG